MAKELPYFRFTPQEWQNGDISLESYELKGIFADIVCYYWVKDCSITLAMLKKRFSSDVKLINELIKLEIITKENDNGFISIQFLDEQYDLLSERRQRRQIAGAKGGKKKSSNAKAKLKQSSCYKDKDNNKDKYKEVKKETLPHFKKWLDYRKENKKPIKNEKTLEALVKRFNSEPIDKIKWVVNNSIENNWQGLFWDKYKETSPQPKPQKSTARYYCPECKTYEDFKGDTMKYNYTHSCGKPLEFVKFIKES